MSAQSSQSLSRKFDAFVSALETDERDVVRAVVRQPIAPIERIVERDAREPLLTTEEEALVSRLLASTRALAEGPRTPARLLTLIAKGTRLCNLRCSYCHDWRTGRDQRMTFDVLARMTARALRDPRHRVVNFIWHGGETTVLPISFYERALLLQARFRLDGQLVRNSIQTNGTRITPAWAEFLRDHDIAVGLSIDGPPEIHDRHRRYASGKGSFDDVLAGLAVLAEHEVDHSVLMVIDEDAYRLGPEAIFRFFHDCGVKRFGLLAAKPTNEPNAAPGTPTEHYVTPARFNDFLIRMYDVWDAHGDPDIRIRELDVLRKRLADDADKPCTLAGGCIGSYFLVEPNGEVAHCDLFLGDPRYTLGTVVTDDFELIRTSARATRLRAENAVALSKLRACPSFDVCNGWCPHERYTAARHDPDHRDECCGLSDLIDHVRARMRAEHRTEVIH